MQALGSGILNIGNTSYNCIFTIDFIRVPLHRMSSTTNSTHITQQTLDFRQKYKTQRCRYWYERGYCPFNQSCAFAHNELELRGKHTLNQYYKTRVCTNFKNHGHCKYGERCQFLHLQEAPPTYSRPSQPTPTYSYSLSEKFSQTSDEFMQDKHRKKLSELTHFGLELLAIKKTERRDSWRLFLEKGVVPEDAKESWNGQKWRERDFQEAFPDYDFSRKPRLGSF